ncbi:MAG: tRNA glutamyl-Q(34) synthetase GluQRS [Chloroflexota bacterium]
MSTYRGRTAPTPSGPLHLGNLRTALLAWLLARRAGGQFVLRLEDLDRARVRPGAAGAALDDMRWLGLDWDEGPDRGGPHAPYLQSERGAIYAAHLRRLQDADLVYPCYCSRADIARAATAPHGAADDGPRYPGTCRDPGRREQQRRRASGRPPALRFRSPDRVIGFVDGLYGTVEQNVAREVGDVVVCRADGVPSYQLAVVVDDALMGMTEVVRGADLLPSTPRQIALYQALGYAVPRFLHVPLVLDRQGERLAKRQDACGATALRQAGLPPARVVGAMAASVGLVEQGVEVTAQELRARANVGRLSRDASSILF